MPRLDPATRNIVIGRLQAGQSQNEVARTVNVDQSTIFRCGTDSNRLVHLMTARGVEDFAKRPLGKIATSGSFIYGIEPFPHQPLQSEYLDCEE
jgi:hypothetical protein